MIKKKVAVLLAASALSIPAYAADTGWFLFASAGQSSFSGIDTTGLPNASVDKSDTGFKLGGGYMLNKFFGVEVAYVDLGKAKVTGTGFSAEQKTSGETVAALGVYPINNDWSVHARAGVFIAKSKLSGDATGSSSDTVFTYGVGGAYNINKEWSVQLEYDNYGKLGDNNDPNGAAEVKPSLISLGVVYRF